MNSTGCAPVAACVLSTATRRWENLVVPHAFLCGVSNLTFGRNGGCGQVSDAHNESSTVAVVCCSEAGWAEQTADTPPLFPAPPGSLFWAGCFVGLVLFGVVLWKCISLVNSRRVETWGAFRRVPVDLWDDAPLDFHSVQLPQPAPTSFVTRQGGLVTVELSSVVAPAGSAGVQDAGSATAQQGRMRVPAEDPSGVCNSFASM